MQVDEEKLTEFVQKAVTANVFAKAGFSEFRKAKATPFNLILEAKV